MRKERVLKKISLKLLDIIWKQLYMVIVKHSTKSVVVIIMELAQIKTNTLLISG